MKKFVLLFAAGLMLGGAAFAQDEEVGDTGALGFGLMTESSHTGVVSTSSSSLRGSLFLDAGTKLFGPFHYGFELQGDAKRLSQSSYTVTSTDVTAFGLGSSDYVIFYSTSTWTTTYSVLDWDISPRGYLSFDLGNKIQLLGFAGLNLNWQSLEVSAKNLSGGTYIDGTYVGTGETYTTSSSTSVTFTPVIGFRFTIAAFYLDYTRFISTDSNGDYSFEQYNKNRWGLGVNLRF